MFLTLKIADLIIKIDSFYDAYFMCKVREYMVESEICDVNIKIDLEKEKISECAGKKLTERSFANWYSSDEFLYECCFYDSEFEVYTAKIQYNSQINDISITLLDMANLYNIDTKCFLSNVMQQTFSFMIIFHDGFAVHASSIVYNNTGLAFSAVSGTGKSTHTGLWLKNYPGTAILNDDNPVMRFVDGKWNIYGTPWAGTTGINKNLSVPLKALVFLERSENNTIRDCVGAEAIKRFFEAVIHPFSDETTDLLLNSLTLLIKHSRICVLGCNVTDGAPKTVREFLYD